MKVVAVTLLVLAVGVELGVAQLLNDLNPLDIHYLNNCAKEEKGKLGKPCKPAKNAKPIAAYMGPCFNTPGCKIPRCCGIIAGRDSLYRIEYEAEVAFNNGTFNGNLGGIAIGKAVEGCEDELLAIPLPAQILVPTFLPTYSRDLCKQTTCPQKVGGRYRLDIPFRFITTALSTFDIVKADFVAQVITDKKEQALCWGLYANLVNSDLVDSVCELVGEIATDPFKFLTNPFPPLSKPLVGVIGGPKENEFAKKHAKTTPV